MSAGTPSLLTFLDAPIVVVDPQGFVTYMNPAFERRFRSSVESSLGQALATLFDGGAREAVLSAVAESCSRGGSVRFRLRHGGSSFAAVVSPIEANGTNIGVVMLLSESSVEDERCLSLQRDLDEPLAETARLLAELHEQTGGRRAERYRGVVEESLRAIERARKSSAVLKAVLNGTSGEDRSQATLDPARVVQDVVARVRSRFADAGVDLEVLLPGQLPAARGDGVRLEKALFWLLEARAKEALESETVTVAVRTVGRGDRASVVITVVDSPNADTDTDDPRPSDEERAIDELIRSLGGEIRTSSDAFAGRTTAIRLQVA